MFYNYFFIIIFIYLLTFCSNLENIDNIPPTVSITAPTDSSIVRGIISVECEVHDNEEIEKVVLVVNEQETEFVSKEAPYSIDFNTQTLSFETYHSIQVKAIDMDGNTSLSNPVQVFAVHDTAFWFKTDTPIDYFYSDILVTPSNTILVSTEFPHTDSLSYMLASTNSGRKWNCYQIDASGTFEVAFSNDNLYAATFNGVYKSINNGYSWEPTSFDSLWIRTITVDDNGIIYIGLQNALYKSVDDGHSWSMVHSFQDVVFNSLAILNSSTFFAGYSYTIGSDLMLSSDLGLSWETTSIASIYVTSILFDSEDNIYVAGASGDESGGGLYKSSDNGQTWSRLIEPQISVGRGCVDVNNNLYYPLEYDIIYSKDYGSSWDRLQRPNQTDFIYKIAVDNHGFLYAITRHSAGIYRTIDSIYETIQ